MNIDELRGLDHVKYQLLFDVRRSIRYHDRRRMFYERLHHITGFVTILMAGSVLFDLGENVNRTWWLVTLSIFAAILAATDMVIGYSRRASLHTTLRGKFADLEIDMLAGSIEDDAWQEHYRKRLIIEKDEPAVYKVLDLLCHNELLLADGHLHKDKESSDFVEINLWRRWTSQWCHWANWQPSP